MISRRIMDRLELYKYIRTLLRLSQSGPSARLATQVDGCRAISVERSR